MSLYGQESKQSEQGFFSNHKTKKLQFVNLQYKRVWWEAGKCFLKLRLSTKALKTIEKNGLDAIAKKAGIDLSVEVFFRFFANQRDSNCARYTHSRSRSCVQSFGRDDFDPQRKTR